MYLQLHYIYSVVKKIPHQTKERRTKMAGVSLFGNFLKEKLKVKRMSLRELSRRTGIDVSNLSKMERGVIYPPKKKETLEKIAIALELEAKEKQHFFDLANQDNGMFPEDLDSIKENEAIPMLLRAIDNRKLRKEEIEKLVKMIIDENKWQGKKQDEIQRYYF